MPANKMSFLKPFQHNGTEWRTASHRGQQIKQRANSHRRPVVEETEDSLQNQLLFHTICGTSNAFSLPGPQNVYWFVLEESLIDMFKNKGQLEEGKLRKTHEIVKSLIGSDFGPLVYGRLKSQLLPKAMTILRSNLEEESDYLASLESVWDVFFCKILPSMECMLFMVESPKTISIRKAAIVAFRDHILLSGSLEERLKQVLDGQEEASDAIRQMVLVVQDVFECFPPSKNKLEMERICALVLSPFLGYRGLYLNHDNQNPAVKSNEPELAHVMRPKSLGLAVEGDRLSRPMLALDSKQRTTRIPTRKVSLQPVLERSSNHTSQTLNYLMARIYK